MGVASKETLCRPLPQLHEVGTAASIKQLTWRSHPTPHYNVVLLGLCRFRINQIRKETPFLVAKITQLDYTSEGGCSLTPALTPYYCCVTG